MVYIDNMSTHVSLNLNDEEFLSPSRYVSITSLILSGLHGCEEFE